MDGKKELSKELVQTLYQRYLRFLSSVVEQIEAVSDEVYEYSVDGEGIEKLNGILHDGLDGCARCLTQVEELCDLVECIEKGQTDNSADLTSFEVENG